MSEVTHKIEIPTAIGEACDREGSARYALGSVHVSPIDAGGAWLTATNGRMLAVVKTAGEADGTALMPAAAARGSEVSGKNTPVASLNGNWTTPRGKLLPPENSGLQFPACDGVLNKEFCAGLSDALHHDRIVAVTIDAGLLLNLAKSISGRKAERYAVTLLIPAMAEDGSPRYVHEGGIAVLPDAASGDYVPDAAGVLMPLNGSSDKSDPHGRKATERTIEKFLGVAKDMRETWKRFAPPAAKVEA